MSESATGRGFLKKLEWEIGKWNKGNDENAGSQVGNNGNAGNQGRNAGNRSGNHFTD